MKKTRIVARIVLALLPLLAISPTARAVTTWNRVFISTTGNDANNCSDPATPCRSFIGAQAQTNVGGEIIAMATGGYGLLNVTQSVTINGPPGVVIFSNFPVTVNAPGATVVLRGMTIDGTGQTGNGISVTAVGILHVESCVITGWAGSGTNGNGIYFNSAGLLNVKDTNIRGNASIGIEITGNVGARQVVIDRCHLDGNDVGFRADTTSPATSFASATNTTANSNGSSGWICGASSTGQDILVLDFCTGSGNSALGLTNGSANATSQTYLSNCVFANNGTYGVGKLFSGTMWSRGNNTATGNAAGPSVGGISTYLGL